MGWQPQELIVDGLLWVENTFQFNKDFIEKNNKDNDKGYFLDVDVQYPEHLHILHNDSPFSSEIMNKLGQRRRICIICM